MLVSTELGGHPDYSITRRATATARLNPEDHPVLVLVLLVLVLLVLVLVPAPAPVLAQSQAARPDLAHSLAVALAAASPVFHPPALYQARVRTQKHHVELIDLGERAAGRELHLVENPDAIM
ncbi:hypothetical protein V8E54_000117 [Elaphomyces granulatus]